VLCYLLQCPTLNNSQNLNLDFLAASFWVQWTRAHGSAGKCLISGDNNDLCKLGKEYSNASICKFVVYSLQHSETFDVYTFFYRLPSLSYQRSNRSGFFDPPCSIYTTWRNDLWNYRSGISWFAQCVSPYSRVTRCTASWLLWVFNVYLLWICCRLSISRELVISLIVQGIYNRSKQVEFGPSIAYLKTRLELLMRVREYRAYDGFPVKSYSHNL